MKFRKDSNIILISVGAEGFLALLFFIWAHLHDLPFETFPSFSDIQNGFLFSLPLFGLNFILFGLVSDRYPSFGSFRYLRDNVVKPLADELNIVTALIISFCAGFGEELFFRGLVQAELGIIISALLFALLHFGTAVRRFALVAIVYFVIGLYFSQITLEGHGLWVPIITHFFYDFTILIYMRYFYRYKSERIVS
jgi:membrane protease YdiL (CAAX protease family)